MQNETFITVGAVDLIKSMFRETGQKRIAVAYWGSSASSELNLTKTAADETRILCDLFSGACDPNELRKLVKKGCRIKTLDGLHSKVYCSPERVLVGSTNASANGLDFGGAGFSRNIEASILSSDPRTVAQVARWFDAYWSNPFAKTINDEMLSDAQPIWEQTRQSQGRSQADTLVEQIDKGVIRPSEVEARVLFYSGETASDEAVDTFSNFGAGRYDEAQRRASGHFFPFYEDSTGWPVKPGTLYLDFFTLATTPRFGGIWRVRRTQHSLKVNGSRSHRIILLDRELNLSGKRLSSSDIRLFRIAIKEYMKMHPRAWIVGAAQHYNIFDLSFGDFWRTIVQPARSRSAKG